MEILLFLVTAFSVLLHQHALGLHFISVGDWGDDSVTGMLEQRNVAQGMNNWCGAHDCAFIIDTGDNFYEDGVTSVTDSRFDTSWRWVYNQTNIVDKLWYISLGNHDHGPDDGREQFQIDFGQTEPRWYYPSLWYDVHYTDGDTSLHLIVVDTESLQQDKNNPAAQLAWLESTLASSPADAWKIVLVHHPPYSVGNHGPVDVTIADQIVPLVLQYGAHILLSGHEHNLEHITPTDGAIDYVITGAGGRGLYPLIPAWEEFLNGRDLQVDFFGFVYGFIAFEISATTYTAEFVDKEGTVLYAYTRTK